MNSTFNRWPGTLDAPQRNNYFYGKMMDVLHFQMEQAYGIHKRWLLNRLTLGEGVLCGLEVHAKNNKIYVKPGVAIDALGREIIVPRETYVDVDLDKARSVTICLAYSECSTDYMPVLVADCNTGDDCASGTTLESYQFLVDDVGEKPQLSDVDTKLCSTLGALSTSARRAGLCADAPGAPAPVTDTPCVCLAVVEITDQKRIGTIDTCSCRQVVYSNAMLLELILCLAARVEECCQGGVAPIPALNVVDVELTAGGQTINVPDPASVATVSSSVSEISITFNQRVDALSVIDGITFLVYGDNAQNPIAGDVNTDQNPVIKWHPVDINHPGLVAGQKYNVVLKGTGTPHIRSEQGGVALDGEVANFATSTPPQSGDGTPGGDFIFSFDIAQPIPRLTIDAVEFRDVDDNTIATFDSNNPFDPAIAATGDNSPIFSLAKQIRKLRIVFNRDVDITTITTVTNSNPSPADARSKNFLVIAQQPEPHAVAGTVEASPTGQSRAIVFTANDPLPSGVYLVGVLGTALWPNQQPIRTVDGIRLDGEGPKLPSGNGQEGGSFEFTFRIAPILKVNSVTLISRPDKVYELTDPQDVLAAANSVTSVVIGFSEKLRPESVNAQTVIVRVQEGDEWVEISGRPVVDPNSDKVTWSPLAPPSLGLGHYELQIVGATELDAQTIESAWGDVLDGEPNQLPSGDDQPGGSFVCRFDVSNT